VSWALQLNIRIESQAQKERWRAMAKAERRSLSDWARLVLDRATVIDETADQALTRLAGRRKR
jgi:hypothetical protein